MPAHGWAVKAVKAGAVKVGMAGKVVVRCTRHNHTRTHTRTTLQSCTDYIRSRTTLESYTDYIRKARKARKARDAYKAQLNVSVEPQQGSYAISDVECSTLDPWETLHVPKSVQHNTAANLQSKTYLDLYIKKTEFCA